MQLSFSSGVDAPDSPAVGVQTWLYAADGKTIVKELLTDENGIADFGVPEHQGPVAYAYAPPAESGSEAREVRYFQLLENPGLVTGSIYRSSSTGTTDYCPISTLLTLNITYNSASAPAHVRIADAATGSVLNTRGDAVVTPVGPNKAKATTKLCRKSAEPVLNFDVIAWPSDVYSGLMSDKPLPYASVRDLTPADAITLDVTLDKLWPVVKTPLADFLPEFMAGSYKNTYSNYVDFTDGTRSSLFAIPAGRYQPATMKEAKWASWNYSFDQALDIPRAFERYNPFEVSYDLRLYSESGVPPKISQLYEGINTIDEIARDQSQNTLAWRYGVLDKATKIAIVSQLGKITLEANLPVTQNRLERPDMPDNLKAMSAGDWLPTEASFFQWQSNDSEPDAAAPAIRETKSTYTSLKIKPTNIKSFNSLRDPALATAKPLNDTVAVMPYRELAPLNAAAAQALGVNPEHLVLQFIGLNNQPLANIVAWSYDANQNVLQTLKSDERGLVDFGADENLQGVGYLFFDRMRIMDTQTTQGFLQVKELPTDRECEKYVPITVEITSEEPLQNAPHLYGYRRIDYQNYKSFEFDAVKNAYVNELQICADSPLRDNEVYLQSLQPGPYAFPTYITGRAVVAGDTWRIQLKPRTLKIDVPKPSEKNSYFFLRGVNATSHYWSGSDEFVYIEEPLSFPQSGGFGRFYDKEDLPGDKTNPLAFNFGTCDFETQFTALEQMFPAGLSKAPFISAEPLSYDSVGKNMFWREGAPNFDWSEVRLTVSIFRERVSLSENSTVWKSISVDISRSRKNIKQLADGSLVLMVPPITKELPNGYSNSHVEYVSLLGFSEQGNWPRLYQEQYNQLPVKDPLRREIREADRRFCNFYMGYRPQP